MNTRCVPLIIEWLLVLTVVSGLIPGLGLAKDKNSLEQQLIVAVQVGDLERRLLYKLSLRSGDPRN